MIHHPLLWVIFAIILGLKIYGCHYLNNLYCFFLRQLPSLYHHLQHDGDQAQVDMEANHQEQEEVEDQMEDAHGVQSPPQRLTRSMFKALGADPYKTLNLVCGNLGYWFRFNPLGEVFNRHHQVLHLPDRQWKESQNVDSPCMKRPRAVNRLQLLGRRLVPIGVLLALFATLGILLAVFSHRWPVVTCTQSPCGQSSTSDVASAYSFVELCHDSRALLAMYTFQERVSEPKPVQIAINQGVLARILLYPNRLLLLLLLLRFH